MSDYDSMHWTALKKLVEEKGGEWEDKAAAIAFLSNPVTLPDNKNTVTFDKSKPYGEIFGVVEGMPGVRFRQNGCYFNVNGVKVG